jgi:hypothetical protein
MKVCFIFSAYILSSGAGREIKPWHFKGNFKHTVKEHNHNDWVSKVRFIPISTKPADSTSRPWDGTGT